MKIILPILFLIAASIGVYFYYELFDVFVKQSFFSWLGADWFLRLSIIFLFAYSFFNLLSLILKKINRVVLFFISLAIGFGISFINPIYVDDYGIAQKTEFMLQDNFIAENIAEDGYVVAAFFTTTCPFCQAACKNFSINDKKEKQPKTILFFPGNKEDSENFLKDANATFEYTLIADQTTFTDNSGYSFPSVYLLKDKKIINHWIGAEINYSVLDYLASLKD
ncbi:MAG: hypothetical protein ACLGGV_09645 [Bacteroidia bacterium]